MTNQRKPKPQPSIRGHQPQTDPLLEPPPSSYKITRLQDIHLDDLYRKAKRELDTVTDEVALDDWCAQYLRYKTGLLPELIREARTIGSFPDRVMMTHRIEQVRDALERDLTARKLLYGRTRRTEHEDLTRA